eukprot:TRINITY_DN9926_c0_g1_i6.p1 TRINITY_DN9926_c0_g1~~TRINITY_DN9926_c0_g1_i6.p1  ORF type:complete len:548 (+),score=72.18 TRINITY_DN9926_c0_g1_i6:94-1737(+)
MIDDVDIFMYIKQECFGCSGVEFSEEDHASTSWVEKAVRKTKWRVYYPKALVRDVTVAVKDYVLMDYNCDLDTPLENELRWDECLARVTNLWQCRIHGTRCVEVDWLYRRSELPQSIVFPSAKVKSTHMVLTKPACTAKKTAIRDVSNLTAILARARSLAYDEKSTNCRKVVVSAEYNVHTGELLMIKPFRVAFDLVDTINARLQAADEAVRKPTPPFEDAKQPEEAVRADNMSFSANVARKGSDGESPLPQLVSTSNSAMDIKPKIANGSAATSAIQMSTSSKNNSNTQQKPSPGSPVQQSDQRKLTQPDDESDSESDDMSLAALARRRSSSDMSHTSVPVQGLTQHATKHQDAQMPAASKRQASAPTTGRRRLTNIESDDEEDALLKPTPNRETASTASRTPYAESPCAVQQNGKMETKKLDTTTLAVPSAPTMDATSSPPSRIASNERLQIISQSGPIVDYYNADLRPGRIDQLLAQANETIDEFDQLLLRWQARRTKSEPTPKGKLQILDDDKELEQSSDEDEAEHLDSMQIGSDSGSEELEL